MANINLTLKKNIFVPKFFPLLLDYTHRWEIYNGSAGSAKSYFITQKLIVRCCNEKIKILVCRRYATTLRNTCFSLFRDILTKWHLYPGVVKIRETDFNIKFPNGSEIIFTGLDEETKLLSLNDIGTIFVEEAFEVEKPKVEQLNLRLRGEVANKQLIMAFNPISKQHWLYDFCENNPPSNCLYTHSTYKDNPFLDSEVRHEMEEMYVRNPARARVFCDGLWGVDTEGLVITNWKLQAFDPLTLAASGLEHRAGMDVGWIDPSAIIDTLYDRDNKTIYVFNEFYKSGCQLSDLAQAIRDMNLTKTKVYVDAAEARSIAFFKQEGLRTEACAKGAGSVKAGLMFLQDHLIIVHPKCQKFITELENFSYIKSKQTGEWTEDTTHEWSHAIDACRYGYSDIYTHTKMKSMSKSLLSL